MGAALVGTPTTAVGVVIPLLLGQVAAGSLVLEDLVSQVDMQVPHLGI